MGTDFFFHKNNSRRKANDKQYLASGYSSSPQRFDNWVCLPHFRHFVSSVLLLDCRTAAYLPQKERDPFGSIYKPIISWLALFWENCGDRSLSLHAVYDWFKVLVLSSSFFCLVPALHLQHEGTRKRDYDAVRGRAGLRSQ